jgi:hypothetical protein
MQTLLIIVGGRPGEKALIALQGVSDLLTGLSIASEHHPATSSVISVPNVIPTAAPVAQDMIIVGRGLGGSV